MPIIGSTSRDHESTPSATDTGGAAPRPWHRRRSARRRGHAGRPAPRARRGSRRREGHADAEAAQRPTVGPSGRSSVQPTASSASGPASTSSPSRRSATDRASGPPWLTSASTRAPGGPGMWPRLGTTPHDGFSPYTPQKCAGARIDPPMSLPSSSERDARRPPRPRNRPTIRRWCVSTSHGLLVWP